MPIYEIQPNAISFARMRDLRRRLRRAIVVLACTVLVSSVGLVLMGPLESLDDPHAWFLALWDTLNLVSTVGNLDEDFTVAQRAWAMFVIVFGLGAVLYGFGTKQSLLNHDVFHL